VKTLKEEAIVNAIAARDADMIAHVIQKYARLLWPVASAVLKNVGSEQDVEECVADAFIYLWEHPEKFDPGWGKLKSMLCIVARSRAIDRYRALTRHVELPLEEAVAAAGGDMQERLMEQQTRQELLAAVNELEEPGREILVRRYYYGQKPRDIALALGMTAKQVDNSLYRTKQRLRRVMQER